MKKFLETISYYIKFALMIILIEVLYQLILPVLSILIWWIMLPVKLIILVTKCDKLCTTTDKVEEWLKDTQEWKLLKYTLLYLLVKGKYDFAMKFGWAL